MSATGNTADIRWDRKIIHVDMDAFFAAIEQRDQPDFRGRPVVVGGAPNSRGVVSTCSYEARKFGVHSAMPAAQAKRLCPHAIFLSPDFEKYRRVSFTVMKILEKYTKLVEPVSLDEAYLDVTQNQYGIEDPVTIARLIKQNIRAVTQLTASAGVAGNLYLAKIASDMNKPDGLTVLDPEKTDSFLQALPVRKIPGVGPVTEKELHELKIRTCGQLVRQNLAFLTGHFGKFGLVLHQRALGIDDRKVEPNVPSKQYSMEETFSRDILDLPALQLKLQSFAKEVFQGLQAENRMGRTLVLKVKYHDFQLITRSHTFSILPSNWEELFDMACLLLKGRTQAGKKPVRLLGLGLSQLQELQSEEPRQKEFFSYKEERNPQGSRLLTE